MTCSTNTEDKKKKLSRTHLFSLLAERAHLATMLTEPLSKLQSEAGLRSRGYSLGEVVRKKGNRSELGPPWKMQRLPLINIQQTLLRLGFFLRNMSDKKAVRSVIRRPLCLRGYLKQDLSMKTFCIR